jgi:hypothetical protein
VKNWQFLHTLPGLCAGSGVLVESSTYFSAFACGFPGGSFGSGAAQARALAPNSGAAAARTRVWARKRRREVGWSDTVRSPKSRLKPLLRK